MTVGRYEVEETVDPCIFDILSIQSALCLVILLKLLIEIRLHRFYAA